MKKVDTNFTNAGDGRIMEVTREGRPLSSATTHDRPVSQYSMKVKSGSMNNKEYVFTHRTSEMARVQSTLKINLRSGKSISTK